MVKRAASLAKRGNWTSAAARRLLAHAGNPATIDEAVRIVAADVLAGVVCPPTDLEAVSARAGAARLLPEDLPFSGELRREGGEYVIVYAAHARWARQRFTIAHEIGHLIFEKTGANPPRVGRELERLCDMLATEILLPAACFKQQAGSRPSLRQVFALAKTFEASLAATTIRCCELGEVSAFEVQRGMITWAHGIVRTLAPPLQNSVARAVAGEWIDEVVTLPDRGIPRDWRLEGVSLARGTGMGRALFLLQPWRPDMPVAPGESGADLRGGELESRSCAVVGQEGNAGAWSGALGRAR